MAEAGSRAGSSWRRAARRRFNLACIVLVLGFAWPQSSRAAGEGYLVEDVRFSSAGDMLRGTLYRAQRPVAAVVIVHGSGQEKRMSEFAALLAGQGITSLTYDKRGVGESGGTYVGPEVGTNNVDADNLALLAGDAAAAVHALSSRLGSAAVPTGLLGFSQAGWIIPLAARQEPAVRFMVLFSGPVVTTREQLRFQFLTEGRPDFWDTQTESAMRERLRTDPDRYPFTDTDPRESLAQLAIPGLWLFGGRDVQLPVQLSIERLRALDADGTRLQYRLYPRLDHNTGFSASGEPVAAALQWVKTIGSRAPR